MRPIIRAIRVGTICREGQNEGASTYGDNMKSERSPHGENTGDMLGHEVVYGKVENASFMCDGIMDLSLLAFRDPEYYKGTHLRVDPFSPENRVY